eukprot:11524290-Alexandrium_andersonii.AAC.1
MDEQEVASRVLGSAGARCPCPPRASGLGSIMAGALRGGAFEPAGGGAWHWAHVPVRDARSLAG